MTGILTEVAGFTIRGPTPLTSYRTRERVASWGVTLVMGISKDHCLDTLSDYGPGRESCTDRAFSPRPGVLSGFVFQRRSPGDTTLSERGHPDSVL